jgi:hypothetical protein
MNTRQIVLCAAFAVTFAGLPSTVNAQLVQHVSESYPRMVAELPFQAPAPIARELKFTVYRQMILKGEPQRPVFATNEDSRGPTPYAIPQAVMPSLDTGASLTALYERKREDARSDGNGVMEAHYSRMSDYAHQSQVASERLNAQLGLMISGMDALATIGQALLDENARTISEWVATTTGAVGPAAPEGTVLHLGFFEYVHAERFAIESRAEFVVTATLEMPNDETAAQSAHTTELYTYRKRNPEAATPRPGFVLDNDDTQRVAQAAVNAKRINGIPFGIHHAIVGHATLAGLYAQIAEAATTEKAP